MIEPIFIGTVNGKPVRFFKTPLTDGKPDFPWHSVDDLQKAAGFDRQTRRHFLRSMQQKDRKSIATPDGIVVVAPHYMAQGLVGAAIELGVSPGAADNEYHRAVVDAFKEIEKSEGVGWNTFEYAAQAYRRWKEGEPS
ncbi:MAG: hypothetical protein AXW12_09535 [Thalassospira sp. Nap_22]|nr:MAG: hypothetical protein AXW12_09535 [Thalassospira sp. Nap_22]